MKKANDLYEVQKLIDKRNNPKTGQVEYKVKWKGYPYEQCTWEPFYHLAAVTRMVNKFNKSYDAAHPIGKEQQKTHQISKNHQRGRPAAPSSSDSSDEEREAEQKELAKKNVPVEQKPQENKDVKTKQQRKNIKHPSQSRESIQKQTKAEHAEQPFIDYRKSMIEQQAQAQKKDRKSNWLLAECDKFSDFQEDAEVIQMARDDQKQLFFQIRLGQQIKWLSNSAMKKRFPLELIKYYEKYLTLTVK